MPKTERRLYTFDELDRIICKRPEMPRSFLASARVRGNVRAITELCGENTIFLRYVAEGGRFSFDIAQLWRVADGDTIYKVPGCSLAVRATTVGRSKYRTCVKRFTPRDISGRTPRELDCRWYRVRDGAATEIAKPEKGRPFCWQLYPQCVVPSMKEWLAPAQRTGLVKFVARSRAFAVNLRRELGDGLPCKIQLLTRRQAPAGGSGVSSGVPLFVHVCTPPTRSSMGRRLIVESSPHNHDSRRHFHVDGDYAIRHSQFAALETTGSARWRVVDRWPCSRDAIVGIKEWVLSTVYIPGPM